MEILFECRRFPDLLSFENFFELRMLLQVIQANFSKFRNFFKLGKVSRPRNVSISLMFENLIHRNVKNCLNLKFFHNYVFRQFGNFQKLQHLFRLKNLRNPTVSIHWNFLNSLICSKPELYTCISITSYNVRDFDIPRIFT